MNCARYQQQTLLQQFLELLALLGCILILLSCTSNEESRLKNLIGRYAAECRTLIALPGGEPKVTSQRLTLQIVAARAGIVAQLDSCGGELWLRYDQDTRKYLLSLSGGSGRYDLGEFIFGPGRDNSYELDYSEEKGFSYKNMPGWPSFLLTSKGEGVHEWIFTRSITGQYGEGVHTMAVIFRDA